MTLHDLFTDRQTYPCPWILVLAMETLKNRKNSFLKLRINANPVVADREDPSADRTAIVTHKHEAFISSCVGMSGIVIASHNDVVVHGSELSRGWQANEAES